MDRGNPKTEKTCSYCWLRRRILSEWYFNMPWCDPCELERQGVSPTGGSGNASNPSSGTLSGMQSTQTRNLSPPGPGIGRGVENITGFNYPSATDFRPPSRPASRPPSSHGHRSGSGHSSSKHEENRKGKAVDYSTDRSSRHTRRGGHSSHHPRDHHSRSSHSHRSSSSSSRDSHSKNPAVYKGKNPDVSGGDIENAGPQYVYVANSSDESDTVPQDQEPIPSSSDLESYDSDEGPTQQWLDRREGKRKRHLARKWGPGSGSDRSAGRVSSGRTSSSGDDGDSTYDSDPQGRPVFRDHHFTMSSEEAARRQYERDARR